MNRLIVGAGAVGLVAAATAAAGPTVPLGASLGVSLGNALGSVLGIPLGSFPVVHIGLLAVAATSLVVGIALNRRKRDR